MLSPKCNQNSQTAKSSFVLSKLASMKIFAVVSAMGVANGFTLNQVSTCGNTLVPHHHFPTKSTSSHPSTPALLWRSDSRALPRSSTILNADASFYFDGPVGTPELPVLTTTLEHRIPKLQRGEAVSLTHPSSSTKASAGTSHGLLNPEMIQAMQVAAGPNCDPELGAFFEDFSLAGPMASMRHLGKPGVASRLSALMAEVTHVGSSEASKKIPPGGWGRLSFTRQNFSSL
mmetsp:Transcript_25354/g.46203  ORF Transcript_25354/g.46203 Transcript_25354/m.46203 type:complete len:231 (+) Transcript_25354:3-695(+)